VRGDETRDGDGRDHLPPVERVLDYRLHCGTVVRAPPDCQPVVAPADEEAVRLAGEDGQRGPVGGPEPLPALVSVRPQVVAQPRGTGVAGGIPRPGLEQPPAQEPQGRVRDDPAAGRHVAESRTAHRTLTPPEAERLSSAAGPAARTVNHEKLCPSR